MTALLWLLIAVPLGSGALLAVSGPAGRRAAVLVALVAAAATLAAAAAVAVGRPAVSAPFLLGLPVGLRVDGLSAMFALTIATVTLAVLVHSAGELGSDPARPRFFGLMLLFAGGMLLTVTATDLLAVLLGWELMGATSYALIGYWWHEPRRVRAANTAFLTTRLADVGLYLAAGAALAGAGTLRLEVLPEIGGGWGALLTAGVVAAALGKSAQLPFSFWLSRAMEGPSPVSALLHSAAMVAAGGYLLLRLEPVLTVSGWGAEAVAWAGAATALALGAVAVAQSDLKQLLAASTCSQIGFVVLGAGAGSVAGGTMQFVAHAATKTLLFLAAGAWLSALGTKDLLGLRGAARRYPVVGVTFGAGAVTLAGLPPFSLWVTKDEVLAGALEHSPALYAVGLAAVLVSAAYAIKALVLVVRPVPQDAEAGYDTERAGTRRVGRRETGPLLVLAVAAVVLGVQAVPAVAEPYRTTLHATGEPSSSWWELALSAAVAVAAAAAFVAARPRAPFAQPGPLARWLDLERLAHAVVVRPTLALARALAVFDDRYLDRGVVDMGVGRGLARLGQWARRPQTGQLHQYYAQAAAGLVVLFAVFLLVR